jgi:phenylalanyl-tRNA synthetase beta chain
MKVPISWLNDYVDLTISIEELADRLTLAGLEVEHIEYYSMQHCERVSQRSATSERMSVYA